jgi:hypothetical protein
MDRPVRQLLVLTQVFRILEEIPPCDMIQKLVAAGFQECAFDGSVGVHRLVSPTQQFLIHDELVKGSV